MKINTSFFPVINQPTTGGGPSRFFGIGLIFLLFFTSCSSSHKIQEKHKENQTLVDKSVLLETSKNQTVTAEKADTLISTQADTTQLRVIIPDSLYNEPDSQTIETSNLKIIIHSKPVFIHGKHTATSITAIAIKKPEDLHVVVEKTTTSNSEAQTQQKNNIDKSYKVEDSLKDIAKQKFNLAGLLFFWGIFIFIILAVYWYLHKTQNHGRL